MQLMYRMTAPKCERRSSTLTNITCMLPNREERIRSSLYSMTLLEIRLLKEKGWVNTKQTVLWNDLNSSAVLATAN